MALGVFGLTTNSGASDLTIAAAGEIICTPITALTGMQSLTLTLDWRYGSGGTTFKVYLQTSVDGGNTWFDIACWAPTNANAKKGYNFSALTPVTTPVALTDGAMTDNTAQDGLLGDRVRLKKVSTGTYAGNSLLVGRMVAH